MGRIIIIVAADEHRGIGKNNALPWHLREDMRYFKKSTLGQVVVMGRKTFDSIGGALKDRTNVVVTKDNNFFHPNVPLRCSNPDDIIRLKEIYSRDIFIIGGEQIYKAMWDKADLIYYTRVHAVCDCDRFVPEIPSEYTLIMEKPFAQDDNNDYPFTFEIWKRKKPKKLL